MDAAIYKLLSKQYFRVLLNPDDESFYREASGSWIVVQRLVSGAPVPRTGVWHAPLEKLLVDLFSRKVTGQLIDRSEYRHIFEGAFRKYAINESCMFRYAGRRHVDGDIIKFMRDETDIRQRVGT